MLVLYYNSSNWQKMLLQSQIFRKTLYYMNPKIVRDYFRYYLRGLYLVKQNGTKSLIRQRKKWLNSLQYSFRVWFDGWAGWLSLPPLVYISLPLLNIYPPSHLVLHLETVYSANDITSETDFHSECLQSCDSRDNTAEREQGKNYC